MSPSTTTRFAPSPTGRLHLGNARTALYSWLLARRMGGRFLLRIEDTDLERAVPGAEAAILDDLGWLGLAWDGVPVHQSARAARHAELLALLEQKGQAYPCFCSETELEVARRTALAAGRPPRYAGTCADLTATEIAARRAAGRAATLRFRLAPDIPTAFQDLVHGLHQEPAEAMGDFVIRRSDGVPTFLFANAVDDFEMGVSHVLRGDDHMSNTPRQIALLNALIEAGAFPRRGIQYGHLPMVLGSDGKPLSKRDGASTLHELRDAGWLPLAVANHLARLGHSGYPDGLLALDDLARGFLESHLGRSPARFDVAQLEHWQRLAIAALDETAFAAWIGDGAALVPAASRPAFLRAVRGNLLQPRDARGWAEQLFGAGAPSPEALGAIEPARGAFFGAAVAALDAVGADYAAFTKTLAAATGAKGRALHAPVRAAVTGRSDGPELAQLFPLLGRERLAARFRRYA